MPIELAFLVQGKAETPGKNSPQVADQELTELSDKGKRAAQRMGVWLARQGLLPDTLICSPAGPGMTCGEKLLKAAGATTKRISKVENLDRLSGHELAELLAGDTRGVTNLLLVASQASIETWLGWLLEEPGNPPLEVSDSFLFVMSPVDSWDEIGAKKLQLAERIEPGKLPKQFPFPTITSSELRPRPAYYYRQSAVIPFRRAENGIEILLISSSKKNHWVVPKGIHEPGLSAQDSAAREALEEAGIEGDVGQSSLGCYRYVKWGAECRVEVYSMEVKLMLSESDWQESHRERIWVNPEDAAKMVKQAELGPLIRNLAQQVAAQ